jgi:hypothetical protein
MSEEIKVGDVVRLEVYGNEYEVLEWRGRGQGFKGKMTKRMPGTPAPWQLGEVVDCLSSNCVRVTHSSPTKEAESPALRRFKEGVAEIYASDIAKEEVQRWMAAKEAEPVDEPPSLEEVKAVFRSVYGKPERAKAYGSQLPYMTEAEICAATEKRNAEYQLEQAAAIKKRWLEQQANSHQYMAYGVVTAPGWAKRGVR